MAPEFGFAEYGSYNSQNLYVLSVKQQSNQYPLAIGGGQVSIADESALIPEIGSSGTVLDVNKTKNKGKISTYEVRDGDTLSQIAEMFDVSVNTIRWANDIKKTIVPGQTLIILPVNGVTHIVKTGGTIEDVAKIYKADVQEIALFNGISVEQKLNPGDKIIVPNVDPGHNDDDGHNHGPAPVVNYASATRTSISSGYFGNPVPGAIITQGLHGYNGIDFGAPLGTPVLASADGTVISSREGGWNGGYGNMIIISHANGTQTLYSHQSRNAVYVGQEVKKGEVIGYIGSTGRSTGPHLHFEVRGTRNPFEQCKVGSVCTVN